METKGCKYEFQQGAKKGELCNRGCRGELCKLHKPTAIERRRNYYNNGKGKEINRNYEQKNKVVRAVQKKKWKEDNKEYYDLVMTKWREEHKEELKDYLKEYRSTKWQKTLYHDTKRYDKDNNKYFDITEDYIDHILDHQNGECYHCNIELNLSCGDRMSDQVSIDRIDNDLGHSKGNVVLSCWNCNFKRRNKDISLFTPNPKYTILNPE